MTDTTFYKLYSQPLTSKDTSLFGNYILEHDTTSVNVNMEASSFFTGHELTLKDQSYIKLNQQNSSLAFSILIADIIILLILFTSYRKQKMHLALFSNKFYQQIAGKSLLKHPVGWSLFFVYSLNTSLLIVLFVQKDFIDFSIANTYYLLPRILGAILLFYLLKIIVIFFTGALFNVSNFRRIYIDYLFLWFVSMAIFLSAYLWFELYYQVAWLHYLLLVIWLVFTALRIAKPILRIIPKSDFNSFHFFIYLCSVEILPLIVLGKLVMLAIL